MPRYRNMNQQQQARVQSQMQSGNFGPGAAGRVAERRAGRIQTTPNIVSGPAPVPPSPTPPPAPMQPPAMEQIRPQMPMQRPRPMQPMGQMQSATQQDTPYGYAAGMKGQMVGQAVDQMRAKLPAQQPFGSLPQAEQAKYYAAGGAPGQQADYASEARQWQDPLGLAQQKASMGQRQPMQQQPMEQAQQFQPMQKKMGPYQGY